jgi:hypothetical protein
LNRRLLSLAGPAVPMLAPRRHAALCCGLAMALTALTAPLPAAAQTPPSTPPSTPAPAASAPAPAAVSATPAAPASKPDSRFVAPGFGGIAKNDSWVVMPVDVELFSVSAGGVLEPKADWTRDALGHMKSAIAERKAKLGLKSQDIADAAADDHAELIGLHAAVARSVSMHHFSHAGMKLPSKNDQLDWSFGDALKPIQAQTGARYGLFVWVRDSYASGERKAAMVFVALLTMGNVVLGGGGQVGYASLVDLDTGRLVWFNQLARGSGDLREPAAARETIEALFAEFPLVR